MNLREAIEAGSQRVSRRGQGAYLRRHIDGEYAACALGAAYLGCHPETDMSTVMETSIAQWVDGLWVRYQDRRVRRGQSTLTVTGAVINTNDGMEGDWDIVLDALDQLTTIDETPLTELEVC